MKRPMAAVGLALMLLLGSCGGDAVIVPSGVVREPPPDVSTVVLPDGANSGDLFAMKADPGDVLIVYFGYTSCPDICPTTLADLRSAVRELGDDASKVSVAMVTVDPGRDDAARLTAYVQSFFADGHALRTDDDAALLAAADAFGAAYEVAETDDGIEVGHTTYLYAVDSDGLIRLQWSFGTLATDLTNDIDYLLKEAA